MKIIVTGSLRNISKPLSKELIQKGHSVTVISSKAGRQKEIEAVGAKAAIGTMQDIDFLKWAAISDKMLANTMLKRGMNEKMVKGIVGMGAAARSGKLYEDYYQHRPVLSQTKLKDYAKKFALEFRACLKFIL